MYQMSMHDVVGDIDHPIFPYAVAGIAGGGVAQIVLQDDVGHFDDQTDPRRLRSCLQ
jgi:hypothetical protein